MISIGHNKDPRKFYYTVLYYSIYYSRLYYITLYHTILHHITVYYTILYDTILYYTILYYTILYYTILYYTILYYTILYYTILYYIIFSENPADAVMRPARLRYRRALEGRRRRLGLDHPHTLDSGRGLVGKHRVIARLKPIVQYSWHYR